MPVTIDGKQIDFTPGETVLAVAKRAGVDIPNLCSLDWASAPAASCRLCVVEVEGSPRLMTSCTLPARDGLSVKTHTTRVLATRRNILELLLASHPDDCLVCSRSKSCELSRIAADLGVRERRYPGLKKDHELDLSSPAIVRDPNKCVLCGRCVTMCHGVQGVGAIDFIGRGFQTRVGPGFHPGLNVSSCVLCGQCVRVCPTGALVEKSHVDEVVAALGDAQAHVVAQIAPAIPATLLERAETGGLKGALQRIAGALKRVGFAAVFDTTFAADLTIMEEASELVRRIQTGGPLPMFTSCSPAWVRYVEQSAPRLIPHLSTCKSPQQMAGALIKRYYPRHADLSGKRLVSVAVMPCTAKKGEAQEHGDVDFVLTTRELEQLLARFGIDLSQSTDSAPLDPPFSDWSGAGRLFAGSGGVMEAAIRTAHKLLTGTELRGGLKVAEARGLEGVKRFSLGAGDATLHFGVVSGLGHVAGLLAAIEKGGAPLHFVEVMSCPGGCVGGGGQPYATDIEAVRRRLERLYEADRQADERASHDNQQVQALYQSLLGEPLSQVSHQLLHRRYASRAAETQG